ncbi:cytochrome P450 [Alicyclobacillus suci]|uniref:cytochrome P450 n=1 Tax=Alicyclobacillus suci TaxID=2816080 RepID=UPI001A8C9574|nr:cytochrome P450 [Alicyclobacillus suci]
MESMNHESSHAPNVQNLMTGFVRPALRTREQRLNPFPWYRTCLSQGTVLRDESSQSWDVFGYEEAQFVLKNHAHFSSQRTVDGQNALGNYAPSILNLDPPRHTQLRRLINLAFTPKAIASFQPRIETITHNLLAAMKQETQGKSSEVDLVAALAYPLPVIVIAEMLGVPPEDRDKFKRWSDLLVEGPSDLRPETMMDLMTRRAAGRKELDEYFRNIVQLHRGKDDGTLISALISAQIENESLSLEELLSFCVLLLAAGNETTTNLIVNAWRCLLEHPETFAMLRENPGLIDGVIEETLRYYSPVQATNRIVTEDIEVGGQTFSKGDRVVVWLGAANRDARIFENPDTFIPTRSPNHHMAFGHGIHFCLGAPLAKLEAKIAIVAMLSQIDEVSAVPTDLTPIISGFVYGVKSFPIQVTWAQ